MAASPTPAKSSKPKRQRASSSSGAIKADGYTRCTFEIEQEGQLTKLAVTHEAEADQPHKLIEAVSQGWPRVLSSLKSLLETGAGLPGTDRLPRR
jgi:hypothetical protein